MNNNYLHFTDGTSWNTGSTKYLYDYEYGQHTLFVAIQFNLGEDKPS